MEKQVIDSKKWLYEQDYFRDTYSGYEYVIKRIDSLGHLCGYVKVKSKWLESKGDYEFLESIIDVHGGVTYFSRLTLGGKGYWAGFDCAHAGDLLPSMYGISDYLSYSEYRDLRYVRKECKRMIKQLKELERGK